MSRRPGRAVLTVVAVALAASLFTALLTIARTAETRVLDELAKGGPLAGIKVAPTAPNPAEVDEDNAKGIGQRELDDEAIDTIAGLPGVREVIPVIGSESVFVLPERVELPSGTEVTPRPTSRSPAGTQIATLIGVDINKIAQLPVTVTAGRVPAPGSLTEVAVTMGFLTRLGLDEERAAEVVGLRLPMGTPRVVEVTSSVSRSTYNGVTQIYPTRHDQIIQRWSEVEVVGVVAQEAASGEVLGSLEMARGSRAWSGKGHANPFSRKDANASQYRGIFVVAAGIDNVGSVRDAIADVGYSSSAPENLIASVRRYLHVVEIVLGGIAVIALLIASLGISNALLSAVRERRREIGVLKAIGARDRDVRRVFLIEAAVLGVLGGAVGAAAGLAFASGVGEIVNRYLTAEGLSGVEPSFSPVLIAIAVVGSTVLATGAGVLPASRAARLPAREAVDA